MRNNNGASIRRLSNRSLRNNRMRNLFAVLAIVLTGILFTATFSLAGEAMQVAQEHTMREVGGKFHAGLKAATRKQYEKVIADPLVKKSSYNVFIGTADNFVKRQTEIRYLPETDTLADMFITLAEGRLPEAEQEIVVDTFVLEELGLPCELGQKVPLRFRFMGEMIEEEFEVCGWYQGDAIGHASEVFLSERYWTGLRGTLTDEDFQNWGKEHPEDKGVGLLAGNLFFDDVGNLEEKIETVIRNAGYDPDTELSYGVNWAYMSSRLEETDPMTVLILICVVAVILVTGYLIIYNIFQISVISDIRFYGLLKTIGTTKRQIRRLVRRQALMLSAVGIPLGLAAGYGIGALVLPFMLSFSDYDGMEVALQFQPWILLCGAGFSAFTVYLSSRKPGRIAGSVSPIEAVRYTQEGASDRGSLKKKKKPRKKKGGRFSALSMALSNLGRSRRTTVVVVMAISLSIILLMVVMTAVGSFRIDRFIEQRITGDFLLGSSDITGATSGKSGVEIAPELLRLADGQEGIEGRQEMWTRFSTWLQIDGKALEQLQNLQAAGRLRQNIHETDNLNRMLQGERSMNGFCYGYSEALLANIQVLDGTFDADKFRTGDYVLLTQILGGDFLSPEEHLYHPGDKVTVEWATEDSVAREITDSAGETVDFVYEDLAQKEYEVMAIVKIPSSLGLHRYAGNTCDLILPLTELGIEESDAAGDGWYGRYDASDFTSCFAVSYQVEEEARRAFEAAVKAYTDQHPEMGYLTKEVLQKEFKNMINVIATIGIALSGVIALIGILNFINAILTQIISRKREFAMLQSIGMTNDQLLKTLVCEGISYIAISGVISLLLGSLFSWLTLRALNNVLLFFEYRFQIRSFLIMMPVLVLVAVAAPVICYRQLRKKSIVERLREE